MVSFGFECFCQTSTSYAFVRSNEPAGASSVNVLSPPATVGMTNAAYPPPPLSPDSVPFTMRAA